MTVPHSHERYLLLAKGKNNEEKSAATGDSHLILDDILKSMEVPICEKEIANKVIDKEH